MDIGHLAVGVAVRRTVFAVERRQGAIRGPVQGKQPRVADRAVGIDHASLRPGIAEIGVHRRQCAGGGGVEQVADLIIRKDGMGAEPGAGVICPPWLLQAALLLQERGAWPEEHRAGAQPRIDPRVPGVLAPAPVGEALEGAAQWLGEVVQGQNKGANGDTH